MYLFSIVLSLFFLIGCEDLPDPQDSLGAASTGAQTAAQGPQGQGAVSSDRQLSQSSPPLVPARHIAPFSEMLSMPPTEYVNCTKGATGHPDNIASVHVYYHAPDEENMSCSFIFYNRTYTSPEKFSETWGRKRAMDQDGCFTSAQTEVKSREDEGWICKKYNISVKQASHQQS